MHVIYLLRPDSRHAGCLNRLGLYSASALLAVDRCTEQGLKSFKIALLRSEHIIQCFELYSIYSYSVDSLLITFYCAMHVVLARYCYRKLSVRPSVRLYVCDVDVSWAYVLD